MTVDQNHNVLGSHPKSESFPKLPSSVQVLDSVTTVDAWGSVLVTGSHGGEYPGRLAARAGARAAIFNDAGLARDDSGIAGLAALESLSIAAVAVSHETARIGDGADTLRHGVITHANAPARDLGCVPPLSVAEGLPFLLEAPAPKPGLEAPDLPEDRRCVIDSPPEVWSLDSVSLVDASDAERIVVTGSHPNLLGGRPATALKAPALGAVYHDAGAGPGSANVTRLPELARRRIPAAAVAGMSARIGDGGSVFCDGRLSHVNTVAADIGIRIGMSTFEFVDAVRRKWQIHQ